MVPEILLILWRGGRFGCCLNVTQLSSDIVMSRHFIRWVNPPFQLNSIMGYLAVLQLSWVATSPLNTGETTHTTLPTAVLPCDIDDITSLRSSDFLLLLTFHLSSSLVSPTFVCLVYPLIISNFRMCCHLGMTKTRWIFCYPPVYC